MALERNMGKTFLMHFLQFPNFLCREHRTILWETRMFQAWNILEIKALSEAVKKFDHHKPKRGHSISVVSWKSRQRTGKPGRPAPQLDNVSNSHVSNTRPPFLSCSAKGGFPNFSNAQAEADWIKCELRILIRGDLEKGNVEKYWEMGSFKVRIDCGKYMRSVRCERQR